MENSDFFKKQYFFFLYPILQYYYKKVINLERFILNPYITESIETS